MRGDVREEHQPRPEPDTPHHRGTHAPWTAPALYHMTHSSPHRTGTQDYRGVPPPLLGDSCVDRNTQKHLTIPSLAGLLPGLAVGSSALPRAHPDATTVTLCRGWITALAKYSSERHTCAWVRLPKLHTSSSVSTPIASRCATCAATCSGAPISMPPMASSSS